MKIRGIVGIVVGALVFTAIALAVPNFFAPPQMYGVTFSAPYARGLGLDVKQAYDALFTDLHVPVVRLMAYWDVIEPKDNQWYS